MFMMIQGEMLRGLKKLHLSGRWVYVTQASNRPAFFAYEGRLHCDSILVYINIYHIISQTRPP